MKPWENGKNSTLILNSIWDSWIFFRGFYLDNVPSYHPMLVIKKLMHQTWENGKKPNFEPKFGLPIFFSWIYLYCMLDIVASYHCIQFQQKVTNQTWENDKKPSFKTDFGPFGSNLGPKIFSWILTLRHVRHCCKLSLYPISRKTNEPNLRKWQKT